MIDAPVNIFLQRGRGRLDTYGELDNFEKLGPKSPSQSQSEVVGSNPGFLSFFTFF